jgi:OTU domain-containing protein 6
MVECTKTFVTWVYILLKSAFRGYFPSPYFWPTTIHGMITKGETLEALEARHKKEQRELISRITSLKKSVTKGDKIRKKEILAEVDQLEITLKERQELEIRQWEAPTEGGTVNKDEKEDANPESPESVPDIKSLSLTVVTGGNSQNGGAKHKVNRQKARMVKPIFTSF